MIEQGKIELSRQRAGSVENLAGPLPVEERVRVQGELSIINAKIKALNTTAAAQLKAAADRRKVAGQAEAQANAARARANAGLQPHSNREDLACPACGTDSSTGCIAGDDDDDPAQTAAIDAWITIVLQDSGIKVRRKRDGLDFVDVPAKWLVVIQRLRAGIHAAARGQELPEVEAEAVEPPKAKKR